MKLLLKSFSWTKYSDRSFFWEVIHLNFWFVSFSSPNNSEKFLIWNKLQKINFLMTTCWIFVHESFIFRNFSYFRTRMHFHLFNLVLFWDGKRYFKNSTTKRKKQTNFLPVLRGSSHSIAKYFKIKPELFWRRFLSIRAL